MQELILPSSTPCGSGSSISCTENYAGFVGNGDCVALSNPVNVYSGGNSSISSVYLGKAVSNNCSAPNNPCCVFNNYGDAGIWTAVVSCPACDFFNGGTTDETADLSIVYQTQSFVVGPSSGSATLGISGDYYLFGYLEDSGSAGCCGTGLTQTATASISVTLQVASSSGNYPYTWQENSWSPADCSQGLSAQGSSCVHSADFNGDYSFNHSGLSIPSGTYWLLMTIHVHVEANSRANAASDARACFSTVSSECYNSSSPYYRASTNCPTGIVQNPCYYTQWKYTTYNLNTPDYSISVNPQTIFMSPGQFSGSTVNLASANSYGGTITLSSSQVPGGFTVGFGAGTGTPTATYTLSSGQSLSTQVDVATTTSVFPGSYLIYINANDNYGIPHTTPLTVFIDPPVGDFTVSASPSSISLQQGYGIATQITVTSHNGFSGSVTLTATPSVNVCGFTAQFPGNSLGCYVQGSTTVSVASGGSTSVQLVIGVCISTPPGAYSVSVKGTYSNLFYTATISVQVLSGPGCGGGSVAAGTMITLADRSQVPVQNLAVGMQLLSYNMTSQQYVLTTINSFTSVQVNNLMIIQTNNGPALRVDQNPAQRVWIKLVDGTITLMSVTDLQVGYDLFQALSQTWVPITGISYVNHGQYVMYDIYTTTPGNYIANGYLDPNK